VERLFNSNLLEFKTVYNEKTQELSTKKVATYHHCTISIFENLETKNTTVIFKGSIHKMWNSLNGIKAPNHATNNFNGYNGNQFDLKQIVEVREHLQTLFNCNADQLIFQNIEFGINTQPNFNPQKFITGLLYHSGVMFEHRYKRTYGQVEHSRFYIKIYNKGVQYSMNEPTLRIEIKIKKMIELKGTGIVSFADINKQNLNNAFKLLLRRFDEIVYYDKTIKKSTLKNKEMQHLPNYKNKSYWIEDLAPQHRDRHKKKLKQFIEFNSDNLHVQLRQELINKCVIINYSNIE